MAVLAARHARIQHERFPHGGDTALMFAARVGDLESAKLLVAAGAEAERCRRLGCQRHGDGRARGLPGHRRIPARQGRRPERRGGRLHRPARGSHAPGRADGGALLAHRADPNAPVLDLDADPPLVARLELQPRAGRRNAVLAGGAGHGARHHEDAGRARSRSEGRAPRRISRWRSHRKTLADHNAADGRGRHGRRRAVGPDRLEAARGARRSKPPELPSRTART